MTYLATCEVLPLPAHSFCSQESSLINRQEARLRVIASEGMGRRGSLFPGVPEQTPEEIYAANPQGWQVRRTLLGSASAWEVIVEERVTNVARPSTWEGGFQANLCADKIDAAWMVTYDDERSGSAGRKGN